MKHINTLIFLVIFFSNFSFSKEEWKKYEYPKSKFKIEFLNAPNYSIDTNSIDSVTKYFTHNWVVEVSDTNHPNFNYIITATEYPKDYIHSDSTEAFIDDIINSTQTSFSENESFELDNSSIIELNGYKGKEYNWTNKEDSYFMTNRVYLMESHLYLLSVFKNNGEKYNKLSPKYFESFESIDLPKGKYTLPKNDEEDTYEINFAGTPNLENKIIEAEYGTIYLKIKTLEQEIDSYKLSLISSEINYKKEIIEKNDPTALNNLYKKSIDGTLKSTKGELISINEVQYNYNLGKEFKCYIMDRTVLMTARLFYINNHLYMHYVISNPANDNAKYIKTFLDSFKLKKIKQ